MLGGLFDHDRHLAGRGHFAVLHRRTQRLDVAVDCGGDIVGPARDVLPLPGGVRRHEVKDRADVLGRGGDVVQIGRGPARFVDFQLQAQPLAHGVERDGVDVVSRLQPVQRRKCLAGGGREFLVAGGGEVLVLGLVPGQAEFGGEARVKPDQGVRVGVGDGVNGRLLARGGSVV